LVTTRCALGGTPIIISDGFDAMVRVWRLADGTLVGETLRPHR
jgi:hypothetical protein